jgi:release factor glutamine methyltransferase
MNRALATRTVGAALTEAIRRLRFSGSPTPRLDTELLLAHVTGHDRSWVLAHPEAELGQATAFAAALDRRARGEPIAYIRGFKEWRSLRIRTDSRALIPRPETELLADVAVAEIAARVARDDEPIVAWEVATGSGAVATALALRFRSALELGRLTLIASDASPEALELASENLAAHGVDRLVTLADADLLEPAGGALPRPGIVVANLPYVTSAVVDTRWGSLGHEPRIALDGGPDGLAVVRRLLANLGGRVAAGASVFLEIGAGQGDAVRALAPPGAVIETRRDLAEVERVVEFTLADWRP